jgi:hypothetical protein
MMTYNPYSLDSYGISIQSGWMVNIPYASVLGAKSYVEDNRESQ